MVRTKEIILYLVHNTAYGFHGLRLPRNHKVVRPAEHLALAFTLPIREVAHTCLEGFPCFNPTSTSKNSRVQKNGENESVVTKRRNYQNPVWLLEGGTRTINHGANWNTSARDIEVQRVPPVPFCAQGNRQRSLPIACSMDKKVHLHPPREPRGQWLNG